MGVVMHYAVRSLLDAMGQLMGLFGWTFLLAGAAWFVNQGFRALGTKWLGDAYHYLVAPGVACHETGHLLGCVLTGGKVLEYVPFRPMPDGELGRMKPAVANTVWGQASLFAIATGPVWFGGLVSLVLTWLLTGTSAGATFGEAPAAGGAEYAAAVGTGALALAERVFSPGTWAGGAWGMLWAYLLVCVTTETTLSPSDREAMKAGLAAVALLVVAGNFIPVVDTGLKAGMAWLEGPLFYLHSMLAFGLATSIGLFAMAWVADFALETAGAGKRKARR